MWASIVTLKSNNTSFSPQTHDTQTALVFANATKLTSKIYVYKSSQLSTLTRVILEQIWII